MKRLVLVFCLTIAGLAGLGVTAQGVTQAASNSDAAHACQQGGYLTLQGSDGTTFQNAGQCVSYAAKGGSIIGLSACVVTSTSGCLTFTNATLPSMAGTGNSITLTGSTSFVDSCTSGYCYSYSLPNNLATGGGTYVEKDSTGTTISQGSYRIADTAGSYEGLYQLYYEDGSYNFVSSCAAATGGLLVDVVATMIDSSTGATQTVEIAGVTGSLFSPPLGSVATGSDAFKGNLTSSQLSITC